MTICVFVICCTLATISSTGVNLIHLFCVCHWNQKHESVDMFICKLLYPIFLQRSLYPAFASNRRHSNHLELYSKCNISSYSEFNSGEIASIVGKLMVDIATAVTATTTSHQCSRSMLIWFISISISIFIRRVAWHLCKCVYESLSLKRFSHCNVQLHCIGSKWKRAIAWCTCLSC